MSTLIISQTVFYIVSSLAIAVVAVLLGVVIYYLVGILRNARNLSEDISQTYLKTKRSVKKIINLVINKNRTNDEKRKSEKNKDRR